MEYSTKDKTIFLNRELNELDRFVIDFTSLLERYVVVSGYVSILFGRSRATEDIDLLIPKMNIKEFESVWKKIIDNGFECLNTEKIANAFRLLEEHAIRFAKKGKPIPNIEFKIIKNDIDSYSYENKIKAVINKKELFISPIEMQIAYKLFLGSEKDLEDAKHLYELFKDKINKEELSSLIKKLNVENRFNAIK